MKEYVSSRRQLFAYLLLCFVAIAAMTVYQDKMRQQDKKETTHTILQKLEPRIERIERTFIIKGQKGTAGEKGTQGQRGTSGTNGKRGLPGVGLSGPPGQRGIPGQKGERGPQGPPGIRGPQGSIGPAGSPGATGEVNVDAIAAQVYLRVCLRLPTC